MATLQDIMNGLEQKRASSSEGSPVADALNKALAELRKVSSAMNQLNGSVKQQLMSNMASRKEGEASDVQKTIRDMLQAKIASDKIEEARAARFMAMAEEIVPQVTEEQLQAFDEQKKAYVAHQKSLEASLSLEKSKADLQNKLAQGVADKQISVAKKQLDAEKLRIANEKAVAEFAKNDKFGTISSAIGGLGSKAQDPLSKFLVDGLGRFVKEKKEAPVAQAIDDKYSSDITAAQKKYDNAERVIQSNTDEKKKRYASALAGKEALIQEGYAVLATKDGIKDPGSKAGLYSDRNRRVEKLANSGGTAEAKILSGKMGNSQFTRNAGSPTEVVPVSKPKKASADSISPSMATPSPKNAKFSKRLAQSTSPATPSRASRVARVAGPVGVSSPGVKVASALGSKAGFINLGGIASALGGIAKNFTKFLGPWGLVASSIMSMDKLVPVISTGAGALMDLTKLVMPTMVSTLIEGFNYILRGINGLIEVLDDTLLGNKFLKNNRGSIADATASEVGKVQEAVMLRKQSRDARAKGLAGIPALDTTTQFGQVSVRRKSAPIVTNPVEESKSMGSQGGSRSSAELEMLVSSMEGLPNTLASIQKSVLDVKLQPSGTTPIMVSSPFLTGWTV